MICPCCFRLRCNILFDTIFIHAQGACLKQRRLFAVVHKYFDCRESSIRQQSVRGSIGINHWHDGYILCSQWKNELAQKLMIRRHFWKRINNFVIGDIAEEVEDVDGKRQRSIIEKGCSLVEASSVFLSTKESETIDDSSTSTLLHTVTGWQADCTRDEFLCHVCGHLIIDDENRFRSKMLESTIGAHQSSSSKVARELISINSTLSLLLRYTLDSPAYRKKRRRSTIN